MVTIKRKVEMNLPELIEWAWDNNIKNERFIADKQLINIEFDDNGDVLIYGNSSIKTVKFSIEVDEELTEDTVFPELVELYEDTLRSSEGSNEILVNKNTSIRRAKDVDECPSRAFYIINDDLTMTLIWRDGKLVE